MPQPTQLRLGDDAGSIPRKRGLPAEYFYQGEPISVRCPSDSSRRSVGVVVSLTGDLAKNNGSMTVNIGHRAELIRIPYMEVSDRVSKLIGYYCILDADDVENETTLEPQTSQKRPSIETGSIRPTLICENQKPRAEGLSTIPESDDMTSTAARQGRSDSEEGELQQLRKEFSRTIQAEIEKLAQTMTKLMDESLLHMKANQAEIAQSSKEVRTGEETKSITAEYSQDQFESALASLNGRMKEELVTNNLLKILQKINLKTKTNRAISWLTFDTQLSTDPSDINGSCPAIVWLDVSGTTDSGDNDQTNKSALHDQKSWSETEMRRLARLFLIVCLDENSYDPVHIDKLWNDVKHIAEGDISSLCQS